MKTRRSWLACALVAVMLGTGLPSGAEAGVASQAVRREIVRRAEVAAVERAAVRAAEQAAARRAAVRAAEQQAARRAEAVAAERAAARATKQQAERQAALRRAVAKDTERNIATKVPAGKPRDVIIRRSRHPEAAAHIDHAQKNGQPTVLHIDRAGAAERRAAATGTVSLKRKPAPSYDRDEYPWSVTREGGFNSNVRFISAHDNRGAGGSIRAQTKDLPDGSKIRVLVAD